MIDSEIIKEIKLALQECGRKLSSYVHKKKRVGDELKKRGIIEKYLPHVSAALIEILELSENEKGLIEKNLEIVLEKKRGQVEDMSFDEKKNVDFDEEYFIPTKFKDVSVAEFREELSNYQASLMAITYH